jgi:hypothetical protein
VAEHEERHELGCASNRGCQQNAAEDEEEVVPADRHVLETEHNVLNERPLRVIVDAEAVGTRYGRKEKHDATNQCHCQD